MSFSGRSVKAAILVVTAVFMLSGISAWAAAQPKLKLNISMTKEVKTSKDGKEVTETVPADKIGSGDTIVYSITYTNEGQSIARDAKIVDPVPKHTTYVLGSATGSDTEIAFSVDGGKTYHKPPVMVRQKDKSGKAVEKAAPAEAYTQVQWTVKKDIRPGESGQVDFKVKVK
jgi:uncharacterized repeat protein (TIGR01451 family)